MRFDQAIRVVGFVLVLFQACLVGLFTYYIVDAYVTPYTSEWLTADAFVPYYALIALFFILCMFLTAAITRSQRRLAWVGFLPIAFVTLAVATICVW